MRLSDLFEYNDGPPPPLSLAKTAGHEPGDKRRAEIGPGGQADPQSWDEPASGPADDIHSWEHSWDLESRMPKPPGPRPLL